MKPIRFALIGCGKIAEQHVRSLHELGREVELAALCDIDKQRMDHFLKKISFSPGSKISAYTDSDRLLERPDIDVAVITTSTDSHIPLVHKALQSGKHVLVEKPLALSTGEARAAAAEARRRGLILAVALQTRYLPQVQAIKQAVEAGRFGKLIHGVVSVRWHRSNEYYRSTPWRGTWDKDGGVLMNQCIHYIDLLQWMLGPVVSVYGKSGTFLHSIETEDMGVALIRFANGAIGVIECSTCVFPSNIETSISLFGEKGSVCLGGERLNRFIHWIFEDHKPEDDQVIQSIDTISHTPLYRDIINAVRSGASPLTSADSAAVSLEIVLAIYKSIRDGCPVKLPIGQFSTKDMTNFKS